MGTSTVFVGGRVFTGRRNVESILVEGGRVVCAGGRREVARSTPTGAEKLDLQGGLVIPGIIDAHIHLRESALQDRAIDLRGARSLPELLARVALAAERQPQGPLVGHGWDSETWPEGRFPTREDLDRAQPNRPVALWRACGHAAVVNSAAIEVLRLEPPPVDRNSERWGRDDQGRFNGVLFETALRYLRPFGVDELRRKPELIDQALRRMAAFGVTTVAPMNADADEVELSRDRDRVVPLPVRLRFYVTTDPPPSVGRLRTLLSHSPHTIVGSKIFTDGSFGARTAWLSEPYEDAPTGRGLPVGRAGEIAELLVDAASQGLQPALHAIGDRAIHRALRLLEAHHAPGRARIEHSSLLGPPLFGVVERVRPHLVVQPSFVAADTWLVERLGPSRARWAYAFRTLLDRGYSMAGSSDAPFDEPDPWKGMATAVSPRAPLAPGAVGPPEDLSMEAALAMYTTGAASALEEPSLGSLEPGSHADLVHLSVGALRDIVRPQSYLVRSTWMGGQRTFDAGPGPARR